MVCLRMNFYSFDTRPAETLTITIIFSLEARRRVNDEDYDFIKPDLSVGQVLLFDDNIPVQVTGTTDIDGLNIRIRNLIEGWTSWVPFFSINFLQNRQCYQQIADERNLFKGFLLTYFVIEIKTYLDFKIMRSQNCLELRPKIVIPTKIHPSLLGDWDPLHHQLNLIDQVQHLEKESIEIISGMVTHKMFSPQYLRQAWKHFQVEPSIVVH